MGWGFFSNLPFLLISNTLKQTKFISVSPEKWWLLKIKSKLCVISFGLLKNSGKMPKALWLSHHSHLEPENVASSNKTMHISSSAKKEERWEHATKRFWLTVANFWTSSSDAPNEASPISCENCANLGSASRGTCPKSSWHVSLREWKWKESHYRN